MCESAGIQTENMIQWIVIFYWQLTIEKDNMIHIMHKDDEWEDKVTHQLIQLMWFAKIKVFCIMNNMLIYFMIQHIIMSWIQTMRTNSEMHMIIVNTSVFCGCVWFVSLMFFYNYVRVHQLDNCYINHIVLSSVNVTSKCIRLRVFITSLLYANWTETSTYRKLFLSA